MFITHKTCGDHGSGRSLQRASKKEKYIGNCRYQKIQHRKKLSAMMVGRDVKFVVDKKTGEKQEMLY